MTSISPAVIWSLRGLRKRADAAHVIKPRPPRNAPFRHAFTRTHPRGERGTPVGVPNEQRVPRRAL